MRPLLLLVVGSSPLLIFRLFFFFLNDDIRMVSTRPPLLWVAAVPLLGGGVVPQVVLNDLLFHADRNRIISIKPHFFGWYCSLCSLGGGVPSSLSGVLLYKIIRTLSIRLPSPLSGVVPYIIRIISGPSLGYGLPFLP